MSGMREKIGRRKPILAILLVGIVVSAAAYIFVQTRLAFAVLTTPPPDIPGPYYIAAELKIYGPPVNLATIKEKMSGTYASDFSYVKWGTNPFYKVFADNTFQEVYYGDMDDVMHRLSYGFKIENDLTTTYNSMKNIGAIDPESQPGTKFYFGNMPGTFIAVSGLDQTPSTMSIMSTYWYAVEGYISYGGTPTRWNINLNGTLCLLVTESPQGPHINASGYPGGYSEWTLERTSYIDTLHAAFYFKEITSLSTNIPTANYRIYEVTDSPGTGYVTKSLDPSSPRAGSTFNLTVRFDTPAANNANITDYYPNVFAWAGGSVTLKKFKIGVGEVASTTVSVTPTPEFSNMKFTINYYDASIVLQTIAGDEYITMDYSLKAPTSAGEYTLPEATIEYTIPVP